VFRRRPERWRARGDDRHGSGLRRSTWVLVSR
jgi:hypothetical protein